MYVNCGYLNNDRSDFVDISRPLVVGSCGTYRLKKRPSLITRRPNGRQDYQLLYIASGKTHFLINGKMQVVGAGNMVLYRPGEPQEYIYYAEDHPEVFWIHFTGFEVKNILRQHGLLDKTVFYAGTTQEYRRLFGQMIRELQLCKPFYREFASTALQQILLLLNRQLLEVDGPGSTARAEIERAVHFFNENYNQNIVIEDYVRQRHMSISWFIRGFKRYTGLPPMQYILSLRLANAKSLLEETDYNISEIAAIVGFDNPLYFSRLFRKQHGVSPAQYRKKDAL